MNPYNLVTILGPTACGKTTLAVALADRLDTAVISADSRQVYRSMDLGTGKDLSEYQVGDRRVPYHLIDIVDAGYKYNVFEYQRDFLNVFGQLSSMGQTPVLCGGTGMYLESVLRGYHLVEVPENKPLREALADKSLEELTDMLRGYKELHNTTDVDTCKRAIRAIEIEEYYRTHDVNVREFPEIRSLTIGFPRVASRAYQSSLARTSRTGNGGGGALHLDYRSATRRFDILWLGVQVSDIIRHRTTHV